MTTRKREERVSRTKAASTMMIGGQSKALATSGRPPAQRPRAVASSGEVDRTLRYHKLRYFNHSLLLFQI